MIYQLLRRDSAWRLMPYFVAAGGLCILVSSGNSGPSLFGPLLYAALILASFRQRATLFQAALPIRARDLFSARCMAFAALVWFPVLAASGVALVKGDSPLGPLDCGAAGSLLIVGVLSVRLTELESPLLIVAPLCGLGIGLGVAAFIILPAAPVLAFCAVASVALFVRTWRAMPESFQLAPVAAQKPSKHRQSHTAPAASWLTLLRSAVPLQALGFLPMICQMLVMRTSSWPFLCCFGIFASGVLQPRTYWLHGLPVARRKLLAIASAIAILLVAAPYCVCVAFGWGGHTSFRLGLINVVCIGLVCIGELILVVAWGSYRIRLLPMWFRVGVFLPVGTALLGLPAISLSFGHGPHKLIVDNFMLHLSQRLPESPAVIPVLGAIAIAAMFRLLEKLDAQAEWPELFSPAHARECRVPWLN